MSLLSSALSETEIKHNSARAPPGSFGLAPERAVAPVARPLIGQSRPGIHAASWSGHHLSAAAERGRWEPCSALFSRNFLCSAQVSK
jgi:hypothetical protein